MTEGFVVSPQKFPFAAFVASPPLLKGGGTVTVRATLVNHIDASSVITELDGFTDAFWLLASSGGLSGSRIPPQVSSIREKRDVLVRENALTWDLVNCHVDERAILTLLNLFHHAHTRHPIAAVEIFPPSSPLTNPLPVNARRQDFYPGAHEPPFHLDLDEPIGDSVSLSIHLEQPPNEEQIAEIESALLTWSVAPCVGAFAMPGVNIEANGMIPEQSVEVIEEDVLWRIERFRMHPAALDSLINCCIALSHHVVGVRALEMA